MAQAKHELMTAEETAAYLRIKVPTLHKWRHQRIGPPATKIGGLLRYDRAALDRWIESQASGEPAA